MITGAHAILYSTNPDADRAFLRDVFQFAHVDAGDGWLIFALPAAEIAVHPADHSGQQELYLTCDDIEAFVQAMAQRGLACTPVQSLAWGRLTRLTLPGGGALGVYQPRHPQPPTVAAPHPTAAG